MTPKATQRPAEAGMHVVEPRAGGLDVHKGSVTATARVCPPGGGPPDIAAREFGTTAAALLGMSEWLAGRGVEAVAMEGTGVYRVAPCEALETAGFRPQLFHAQHVKQLKGRKTDINDSAWLATVCQFGPGRPGYVPPPRFRQLRQTSRYRAQLAQQRARETSRLHKTIDSEGLRLGTVLTDITGMNGRRVLDGIAAGRDPQEILAGLSHHVRSKLEPLAEVLQAGLHEHALWRLRDLPDSIDALGGRIAGVDALLAGELAGEADAERVRLPETVPGIDTRSARTLLAELGTAAEEFPNLRSLAARAGVCPGSNESAGKRARATRPCGPR